MSKKVVVKRKSKDPLDSLIRGSKQFEIDFELVDAVRCECGAEKTYGKQTSHSDWCPKYKKI